MDNNRGFLPIPAQEATTDYGTQYSEHEQSLHHDRYFGFILLIAVLSLLYWRFVWL